MLKYGSDKPDLRNPLEIFDVTEIMKSKEVKLDMFKKLSPVDNSYFYYKVDTTLKNKEVINLIFEFFPPSTLMLKKDEYMFKTLACWNN